MKQNLRRPLGSPIIGMLALAFFQSLESKATDIVTTASSSNPAIEIVSRVEAVFSAPPGSIGKTMGSKAVRATAAPLLGNGDLAVCISGAPERQTFWISKNDFWRLRNGSAAMKSRSGPDSTFLPNFGKLDVAISALVGAKYALRQRLGNATTIATFAGKESTVTQTTFVAATADVMAVTLACEGRPVEVEVSFAPNDSGCPEETDSGEKDGVRFATRAFVKEADIPTRATAAWKLLGATSPKFTLAPGKPVTILLAMASNFEGEDTRAKAQERLGSADVAALEKAHQAWWHAFWEKSFVEIPDEAVMKRYYLSQYVMGSASRNPKFPPPLVGPWATGPYAWCAYWMNYNHAAPFYGLYSSDHIEQADPQDAPMLDFMPTAQKYAKEVFDGKVRGVLFPVGIGPMGRDIYGDNHQETSLISEKSVATYGQRSNASYNLVNMGSRWYATYDLDYGRKIYPYAKATAEFWEDYLVREDDGKGGYRYSVTDAAHEGSGSNRNPITTLGLVRNTFGLMLDMSKELKVDADRRAKWEDILAHLCDYPRGLWEGSKVPIFYVAETPLTTYGKPMSRNLKPFYLHRSNTLHIQHIYPAGCIGLDSPPELLKIARDTIAISPRWHDGNGANSFFPAAARVGYDPQAILGELHKYSTGGMCPNGFSKGNPHGIENCSTVPNTVNEMLMQSHEGVIRFFPVWPKNHDARFGTLRARGAFLVSAELKNGIVTGAQIASEKGRDCIVQNPWPGKMASIIRNGQSAETVSGDCFTLKTTNNEIIGLVPQ